MLKYCRYIRIIAMGKNTFLLFSMVPKIWSAVPKSYRISVI